MEHEGKNDSPYRGVVVQCALLIGIPLICYFLFYFALNAYQSSSAAHINKITARMIALIIGILFYLSCVIAGAFKKSFEAVKIRISEFFSNVVLSFGFAVKNYFKDMKEGGVAFLIYMTVFVGELVGLIVTFSQYFAYYS